MLIPEIWCRLPVRDRDPAFMIENGYLEKLSDFEHDGKRVQASRLGYRITAEFVHAYFGKIFDTPMIVFDEEMLKPEIQDMDAYVDGINNIVEAQQKVAQAYLEDGSDSDACPPLQALLHIMATGEYEGKSIDDAEIRNMFSRDYLLASDWYAQRLNNKQQRDTALWQTNLEYLQQKMAETHAAEDGKRVYLQARIADTEDMISAVSSDKYLERLKGTLGADWVHHQV